MAEAEPDSSPCVARQRPLRPYKACSSRSAPCPRPRAALPRAPLRCARTKLACRNAAVTGPVRRRLSPPSFRPSRLLLDQAGCTTGFPTPSRSSSTPSRHEPTTGAPPPVRTSAAEQTAAVTFLVKIRPLPSVPAAGEHIPAISSISSFRFAARPTLPSPGAPAI